MDTQKKFGLKKNDSILLFFQMLLVILATISSIYLFFFVVAHSFGAWFILSYSFIVLAMASMIIYSIYGYKLSDTIYILSAIPYLIAIFINILLPVRGTVQIALLSALFACAIVFLVKQEDIKFTKAVSILMVALSLAFSVYSAATANLSYVKEISSSIFAYLAMYLSIFTPVILSATYALTYHVRTTHNK